MKPPALTLVPTADDSPAVRAARLQAEIRGAEDDAYGRFLRTADELINQAGELVAMQTLPNGVRDEARRLIPDLEKRLLHMTSIRGRV